LNREGARRGSNKHVRRLRTNIQVLSIWTWCSSIGSPLCGHKKKKKLSSERRQSSLSADHVRAIPWNWPVFCRGGWREKISFSFPSHFQCFLNVSPCTVKKRRGKLRSPYTGKNRSQRGKEGAQNEKWFSPFIRTSVFSVTISLSWQLLVKRKVDLSGFCWKELYEKKRSKIITN